MPNQGVTGCKECSKEDERGQVEGEDFEVGDITIVDCRLVVDACHHLQHDNVEDNLAHDPEKENIGSEHQVVFFGFLLLLLERGEGFSAGAGGAVAPGDIVQVADRVNREHVQEHRHQQEVADEADQVLGYVPDKVSGSEEDWQKVGAQHDNSRQRQPVEVIVGVSWRVGLILICGRIELHLF